MKLYYVINILQTELEQHYADSHFCLRSDTHAVISKEATELSEAIRILKKHNSEQEQERSVATEAK